jgi:diguanylate cyclase (GGDEF)-like protein
MALGGALTSLGFLLLVLAQPGGQVTTRNIDDLLQAAVPLLVALPSCLWRATASTGRMRLFWQLLSAFAASWGLGQLVWCYLEIGRHESPTASDWPTIGYLLASVLAAAAIIVYPGPRLHWAARIRALVDGLLIVTTLLFVSWTVASDTGALQHSGTQLTERLTVLAYPAADIVLLAMLATVIGRGTRSWQDPLLVVGASIVALFLGDSLSIYVGLAGSYQTGNATDVFWIFAFLFLALAALMPPLGPEQSVNQRKPPTWTEFITYGPLGLALAMAAVQIIRGNGFDTVEESLVLVSALLLVVRGSLFVLENRVLMTRIEKTVDDLEWLSLHDPLTGLANRLLFSDRLNQAIATQQRNPRNIAVAYIDIDDFKVVNDTFGHDVGDELLRRVAQRLSTTVREGDTLARLGGDEFAMLMASSEEASTVSSVLHRLLSQLDEPFAIDEHIVSISASIGYSQAFGQASAGELLKQADEAMYVAKSEGKDRVCLHRPQATIGNPTPSTAHTN